MLKGILPPFKVGERRAWPWQDSIGGASPLEYVGALTLMTLPLLLLL